MGCTDAGIHPSAEVHPDASIGAGVEIGPFSVIGGSVSIGEGTRIGSHCVVDGCTTIGKCCSVFTGAVIGSIPQDLKYDGEDSVCVIGDNNRIREYVTVNLGTAASGSTVIGDDNLIMAYSHIAHDCVVGSGTIIANAATLAGHVIVEDNAIIGGLVGIHQFVRLGRHSIVGGCSKVLKDIPPYATADGHPARVYGVNVEGLRRFKFSKEAKATLKQAFATLYKSGLTVSSAVERLEKEEAVCPEVRYLTDFIKSSERGLCPPR